MNPGSSVIIALAIVATASAAAAAEAEWPKHSAGDLSLFVATAGLRIHADHCSASVPALQPRFASLLEKQGNDLQVISKGLLASGEFNSLQDQPVPTQIIEAFRDSFDDMKHNLERQDAASACPKALQRFGAMDHESLKSGLTEALTAVQTMLRNLEKEDARRAPVEAGKR
jgi:hypothetical protein